MKTATWRNRRPGSQQGFFYEKMEAWYIRNRHQKTNFKFKFLFTLNQKKIQCNFLKSVPGGEHPTTIPLMIYKIRDKGERRPFEASRDRAGPWGLTSRQRQS